MDRAGISQELSSCTVYNNLRERYIYVIYIYMSSYIYIYSYIYISIHMVVNKCVYLYILYIHVCV